MAFTGFTDFRPEFGGALQQFLAASPGITVNSGYRDIKRQTQLWNAALQKYGSPEKARHWVAPPGKSRHNMGMAADLAFPNDAARQWAHANAAKYNLNFRMGHEPWHIELVGGGGGDTGGSGQMVDLPADGTASLLAGAVVPPSASAYDLSSLANSAETRLAGGDRGGQPVVRETGGDTAPPPLVLEQASLSPETLEAPWAATNKRKPPVASPLADLFNIKTIGQAGAPMIPGRIV
jgi:hypothetical protein